MNDPRADDTRDAEAPTDGTQEPDAHPGQGEVGQGPPPPPAAEARSGAPTPTTPPPAGRSLAVVLGLFALLVAVAAAGGAAFTWWQSLEHRDALASHRAEAADRLDRLREALAGTQERLAAQEERIAALDRDAAARQDELDSLERELHDARATLEALAREEAGPERSPSLAEIEFLLLLASRELALAGNPRVALAALREADHRVARLDEPGLGALRAAINDEIAAVEAVAGLDREGIALRLGSLARRVDGLPLRASLAPEPAAAGPGAETAGWERLKASLREIGAGLFRVRRSDAPAAALLAPEEAFFLYRNVELDLKSARLAALARDEANYRAGLESARAALETHFAGDDSAVKALLAAIEALEAEDVAPEWPEIRRSLALLRAAGTTD